MKGIIRIAAATPRLHLGDARTNAKELVRLAFKEAYRDETIVQTRDTFLRRFRQSQYKRNCVPDGPKITLSLSPRADWRMPSDS